jgi:hypothetical protein
MTVAPLKCIDPPCCLANAQAHRERPTRGHSAFSEPPPGRDAVVREVRLLSSLREEPFIIIVVPNPKPHNCVALQDTDRTIPPGDAYRPNVLVVIDTLETERRMKGILGPEAIGFASALFEVFV